MAGGAVRWSCDRCEVSAGRLDGTAARLPATWTRSGDSTFCLTCSRELAGEAAIESAPGDCSREELYLIGREALIRFEIGRKPQAPDGVIARACRTSPKKVATIRAAHEIRPSTSASGV